MDYSDTRIPVDGRPIELISSADVDNLREYTYPDAKKATIEDLLYLNPATIKGIKYRIVGEVIQFQTKQGWYYNSCSDCTYGVRQEASGYACTRQHGTHNRFKLQIIVFGNLAQRLTRIDVADLTLAEKMNTTEIHDVAKSILHKQYEFVVSVSDQGYGPGLNFKVFHFIDIDPVESSSVVTAPRQTIESSSTPVPPTQSELSTTPHSQCQISDSDGALTATPADSLPRVVDGATKSTVKRTKTFPKDTSAPAIATAQSQADYTPCGDSNVPVDALASTTTTSQGVREVLDRCSKASGKRAKTW
ncbi:Nucleic acid-binding protein [Corchorus olitorius]|uniref:Nucleic acid-binding protein n=1 Tax=Corchorus olitorius TaxID=93759 RepID=A0A1R3KWG0_9ROSI|nr:Nucleic acid-binding protein [Corchorus olitorius]